MRAEDVDKWVIRNAFPESRSQSQGALNFQLQTILVLQRVWMKFSGQEPSRRLPFHILCSPGTETSWWSVPPACFTFLICQSGWEMKLNRVGRVPGGSWVLSPLDEVLDPWGFPLVKYEIKLT